MSPDVAPLTRQRSKLNMGSPCAKHGSEGRTRLDAKNHRADEEEIRRRSDREEADDRSDVTYCRKSYRSRIKRNRFIARLIEN